MLRDDLIRLISQAIARCQADGALPALADVEIQIERPQNPDHGDYASNVALRLARTARMNPLQIAERLASTIEAADQQLVRVSAAPPGFLNFRLDTLWLADQVATIRLAGGQFGNSDLGGGQRVQVEFVSANPTGPIHIGGGRGAVIGSTLANILDATGHRVEREYYINDAGSQMLAFYDTLCARYLQALGEPVELPAEAYAGDYMIDLARDLLRDHGSAWASGAREYLAQPAIGKSFSGPDGLGPAGLLRMLDGIRASLERARVVFDVWFSERSLQASGDYETAMRTLADRGYLEDREGARWFVSTALGESKDNVVIRSNGIPTYFASDIAYHYNKLAVRGFDRVIDIWGADHQGHVSRMKAVIKALGHDPAGLQVLITQMVALKRGQEIVKVSKRTGDIITLDEVIDEVGTDACRFNFLARSADSQMDFDLEMAKLQANENPVYYVQYAHARIASILRNAAEQGLTPGDDLSLLGHEAELALIRRMLELPELVAYAAEHLEPHHLPHYAQQLATTFHSFYNLCRVISDDHDLSRARLALVDAARIVLARTLDLMGMTAPDEMRA